MDKEDMDKAATVKEDMDTVGMEDMDNVQTVLTVKMFQDTTFVGRGAWRLQRRRLNKVFTRNVT